MTSAPASRIVVPEMLATFEPRLDILPESQRRLWPELDAITSDFASMVVRVLHCNWATGFPRISTSSRRQVSIRSVCVRDCRFSGT
jgi:hypothetical protein